MATRSVSPAMIKALAGSPAAFDSQGLQQPMIDPVMLAAQALPGMARIGATLAGRAVPAFNALGEAGAIFPKGFKPPIPEAPGIPVNLPPGIEKHEMITNSERIFRNLANQEKQYLMNNDFANALKVKFRMAQHSGGN